MATLLQVAYLGMAIVHRTAFLGIVHPKADIQLADWCEVFLRTSRLPLEILCLLNRCRREFDAQLPIWLFPSTAYAAVNLGMPGTGKLRRWAAMRNGAFEAPYPW